MLILIGAILNQLIIIVASLVGDMPKFSRGGSPVTSQPPTAPHVLPSMNINIHYFYHRNVTTLFL